VSPELMIKICIMRPSTSTWICLTNFPFKNR
jgi:hypothetical protein